jgi:uncharacterized membrane protein YfcA
MPLTVLDYLAAAGAAGVAGTINAVAGGGTLVSFPTLVGLGIPAVTANVTNTVALLPGYLAGTWAQRDDLRPQLGRARALAAVAVAGGLGGSVLLVSIPGHAFRVAVPYLIVASCALLLAQDRLREMVRPAADGMQGGPAAPAVYGGFSGAGLGIMLLAVLGLFTVDPLVQVNALKQVLQFVVNLVAAVFFVFSGHVRWQLVPVMAAASVIGGTAGGRLVQVIDAVLLRRVVVVAGVAVAVVFWVR